MALLECWAPAPLYQDPPESKRSVLPIKNYFTGCFNQTQTVSWNKMKASPTFGSLKNLSNTMQQLTTFLHVPAITPSSVFLKHGGMNCCHHGSDLPNKMQPPALNSPKKGYLTKRYQMNLMGRTVEAVRGFRNCWENREQTSWNPGSYRGHQK